MRISWIALAAVVLALGGVGSAHADPWGWRHGYYAYPYGYPYPYVYPYGYAYPPGYVYAQPPAVIYQQPPAVQTPPLPPPASAENAQPSSSPIFKNAQGQNCVTFQNSLSINNQVQPVTGTACQQADGSWKTVQ